MFRVLRFKTYDNLKEQATAASVASNSKNNRNGVMHELLVGKHLKDVLPDATYLSPRRKW